MAMTRSWQHVTYKHCKLGQTAWFLLCDQSSSRGLCMQDYKSLRVAVIICAILVNRQTALERLYY